MSTKKTIDIKIDAKGAVEFEMKGVKGGACFGETAFLTEALGGDAAVVDQQKTSEFYEQAEGYATQWSGEGKDD